MSKVCLQWSLEDLCEMQERDMETLVKSYKTNQVPSLVDVRGPWEFDGSFGWACVV
jgi:precorrin-2 dehydrogenase/sirohydrochlorin ferrochelatase